MSDNTGTLDSKLPFDMTFWNVNKEQVGKLLLESPMTFEGDVDESAEIFFNGIMIKGNTLYDKIAKLETGIDEAIAHLTRFQSNSKSAKLSAKLLILRKKV